MLGCNVKDLVNGLTGVVISRTEWLYGCNRVAIEPTKLDAGKPRDAEYVDEQRVEIVSQSKVTPVPPPATDITLGDIAKDVVTDFEGVVVCKTVTMTGRLEFGIEPTKLKDGKPVPAYNFDFSRVKLVKKKDPPLSKAAKAEASAPPPAKKSPGGPRKDFRESRICRR